MTTPKPNTPKEEVEQILSMLKLHEMAFVDDGLNRYGWDNSVAQQILDWHNKAIAQAEKKARINEVERCRTAWHGSDDKEFAWVMNTRLKELEEQL
jgi:hypothetical protein